MSLSAHETSALFAWTPGLYLVVEGNRGRQSSFIEELPYLSARWSRFTPGRLDCICSSTVSLINNQDGFVTNNATSNYWVYQTEFKLAQKSSGQIKHLFSIICPPLRLHTTFGDDCYICQNLNRRWSLTWASEYFLQNSPRAHYAFK